MSGDGKGRMDTAVLLMLSKHLPGVGFNKHQLLPNPLRMYSFFVFYCMFFLLLDVQNKFQINLSSFNPLSFLPSFRLPPASVVPFSIVFLPDRHLSILPPFFFPPFVLHHLTFPPPSSFITKFSSSLSLSFLSIVLPSFNPSFHHP